MKDKKKYSAEHLPLGEGYTVEKLPVEKISPDVVLMKESEEEFLDEEPIPQEEDEFYDFNRDVPIKGYEAD